MITFGSQYCFENFFPRSWSSGQNKKFDTGPLILKVRACTMHLPNDLIEG